MISARQIDAPKPCEQIETCRVGNVSAVVTRGKDGRIHWFREELDDESHAAKRERTETRQRTTEKKKVVKKKGGRM